MSDKRTISINPDLFKIPDTRKKRPAVDQKIRIKTPLESKVHNKTVRKNIMKLIREKQQDEYKRLFEDHPNKMSETHHGSEEFNNEFDESVKYLSHLVEQKNNSPPNISNTNNTSYHNKTIKQIPNNKPVLNHLFPTLNTPIENVHLESTQNVMNNSMPSIKILPPPQYGCLKGGNLPTYRTFHNRTVKDRNHMLTSPPLNENSYMPVIENKPTNMINNHSSTIIQPSIPSHTNTHPNIHHVMPTEYTNKLSETKQLNEQMKLLELKKSAQIMRKRRQRKIMRRTYRIGRSKYYPKIAVLVSNRTIRNKMTTKTHLLKETPISEIKQYLIKRGLIKIGTTAPNDVLRKMYETVELLCGEVNNHNTETLLHNFINAK